MQFLMELRCSSIRTCDCFAMLLRRPLQQQYKDNENNTKIHNAKPAGPSIVLQYPVEILVREKQRYLMRNSYRSTSVGQRGNEFCLEFNEADPQRQRRNVPNQVTNYPSSVPPFFSLVVDVGCFSNGITGWGVSIHDQRGVTIFSSCRSENIKIEPLLAEALVVRWAIHVVIEQGISSVSINSDAANVVNCLNNKSKFAAIEIVAHDRKELMNGMVKFHCSIC
jgi:hypothetical protein